MTYAGDLTPSEAYDLVRDDPDAVLVDVRTTAEWAQVGIPDLSGLGKQVEIFTYPGTEHAFTNHHRSEVHDVEATGLAFDRAKKFLRENL